MLYNLPLHFPTVSTYLRDLLREFFTVFLYTMLAEPSGVKDTASLQMARGIRYIVQKLKWDCKICRINDSEYTCGVLYCLSCIKQNTNDSFSCLHTLSLLFSNIKKLHNLKRQHEHYFIYETLTQFLGSNSGDDCLELNVFWRINSSMPLKMESLGLWHCSVVVAYSHLSTKYFPVN